MPLRVDSNNMIIIRWFGELLNTTSIVRSNSEVPFSNVIANNDIAYKNTFYATILPVGLQHETRDKKWKWLVLAMPKLAGTLGQGTSNYNFQAGGFALVTKKINEKLSLKGGLFYNREFFGNFWVPIISADWKVSERFKMYGTFPTFYKFEFCLLKHKLYSGLAYKSYTRSFLLPGASHNYIKMNDMSLKLFLDLYIKKKLFLFAEAGQMINYGLLDYRYGTNEEIINSVLYRKVKLPLFFNCGIAYRLRFDFDN